MLLGFALLDLKGGRGGVTIKLQARCQHFRKLHAGWCSLLPMIKLRILLHDILGRLSSNIAWGGVFDEPGVGPSSACHCMSEEELLQNVGGSACWLLGIACR